MNGEQPSPKAGTPMLSRIRCGPTGFTVLFREGHPPTFCQRVTETLPISGPGKLVLNLFEEFGTDGVANKVWNRLGYDPLVARGTRVIRYMRYFGGEPYSEEYMDVKIVAENGSVENVGSMEVISQIELTYAEKKVAA